MDWRTITDEREKYAAYLCSPEWGRLRAAVHERAKFVCERCERATIDAVHHLTYERKYCELLTDLQGICKPCHEFTHGKSDIDPQKIPDNASEIKSYLESSSILVRRWLAFFYECGVTVSLLKNGFDLGPHGIYSPFFIHEWSAWVDIVPDPAPRGYLVAPTIFAWPDENTQYMQNNHSLLLIKGQPWPGRHSIEDFGPTMGHREEYHLFMECRRCEGICLVPFKDGNINADTMGFRNIGKHTCDGWHDSEPVSEVKAYRSALKKFE